jgi:hypothetical protein
VCTAVALIGALVLAACSSTTASGTAGGGVSLTTTSRSPQTCHSLSLKQGNQPAPSASVEIVGVLNPNDSDSRVRSLPFELVSAYGSCMDSFVDSGRTITFAVHASATPAQLTFLKNAIRATGQFQSVSLQHL